MEKPSRYGTQRTSGSEIEASPLAELVSIPIETAGQILRKQDDMSVRLIESWERNVPIYVSMNTKIFHALFETCTTTCKDFISSVSEITRTYSDINLHAPLEDFLRIWFYVPVTLWWKTFSSPFFNTVASCASNMSVAAKEFEKNLTELAYDTGKRIEAHSQDQD